MKKYLLILPIILLSIFPVIKLNAADAYFNPTWTEYTSSQAPTYVRTDVDVTNWETATLYLQPNLDLVSYYVLGSGQSRIIFYDVNDNRISDILLSDVYPTIIGGNAEFNIPNDTVTMAVIIYVDDTIGIQAYNNADTSISRGFGTGYSEFYDQIYNQVYDLAYQEGYDNGVNSVELDSVVVSTDNENITVNLDNGNTETLATPYSEIKNYETELADNFNLTLFIPQLLSLIFGFFFTIFSTEILGVSLLGFLVIVVGFTFVYIIFRSIFK